MAVNSTTARADIYKELYALLNTTLATPNVIISDSFSEDIADSVQVVLNPPVMPKTKMGFELYDRSGTIEIDIYGPKMQSVIELHDDIENTIFSNLTSLSIQTPQLGDSTVGEIQLSGKNIHTVTIPLSFTFIR